MTLSRPVPYKPIWWEETDLLNVTNLDHMDYGILNAFYQSQAHWLVDDSEEQVIYSGSDISELRLYEDVSTTPVLRRRITLNYTGDDITSIDLKVYEDDGTTIFLHYIDTISYDANDNIEKVSRSVEVMPT